MERALAALAIPGWDPRARSVRAVGHGESFDAWLIADAAGALPPLVARVARRADMPKPIEQEAAALREAEGLGLAPRLWTFDGDPSNPLGAPYLVLSFVPGEVRSPDKWTLGNVDAVIDLAARLHAATSRPGSSSGIEWYEGSMAHWRAVAPETLAAEPVARLVTAVDEFVQARAGAFDRVREVALIHGDLVASNILLSGDGPAFIDWEWAEVHDVARDLALIGGQSFGGPWYAPLDDAQVAALVARYCAARGIHGRDATDLAARRDVWMALDRLFSSIHFSRSENPSFRSAAAIMQGTLAAWLGVSISPPSSEPLGLAGPAGVLPHPRPRSDG